MKTVANVYEFLLAYLRFAYHSIW